MANTVQVTYEKGKLYDLKLTDLQPDPEQPRRFFDGQTLAELAGFHCQSWRAPADPGPLIWPLWISFANGSTRLIVPG